MPRRSQKWLRHGLEADVAATTKEIEATATTDADRPRLLVIPGVGPPVAIALVAAIEDSIGFKRERNLTASSPPFPASIPLD